jgi:non-heme chloroperoxidase
MLKTAANPGGLPLEVFDDLRRQLAANRAGFYWNFPIPFYGYNREGATLSEPIRQNWWRQSMMGSAQAQYECIAAFSATDFTDDLGRISVPTLLMHGEDDQIVPVAEAAVRSAKLLRKATLKLYPGLPHGMCTTHADIVNRDLLAFIRDGVA